MGLKDIDGKPIFDAKKSIRIEVNNNDISRADRKEPADCAMARACRRSLHAKEVRVHLGRVYVRQNEGNWQRYLTSPALRTEIISFDRGGGFQSGEYVLRAPQATKRLGADSRKRLKRKRKSGSKTRQAPKHIFKDVRGGPA